MTWLPIDPLRLPRPPASGSAPDRCGPNPPRPRPGRAGARTRRLAAIAEALEPYEETKDDLTEARKRYRALLNYFLAELKAACDAMEEGEKRELVLDLIAQDVQAGMDAAMGERRTALVLFVEQVLQKYQVTLLDRRSEREATETKLERHLKSMGYA